MLNKALKSCKKLKKSDICTDDIKTDLKQQQIKELNR